MTATALPVPAPDRSGARQGLAIPVLLTLLVAVALGHLNLQSAPAWHDWQAWWQLLQPQTFDQWRVRESALPRVALACLIGMALGLSGCLLQQLFRNPLVDTMTLGAAAGARLALAVAAIFWPVLAADGQSWLALGGAASATALVMAIAGGRHLAGLPLILAGLALTLMFGALASTLLLLNDQYARELFLWGAGDLTQYDLSELQWLWPRLLPALAVTALLLLPLQLLRLGSAVAEGRGLPLIPVSLAVLAVALWLNALAITVAGLIGFIGLIAPNLARLIGARTVAMQWICSAVIGAVVLVATDALAIAATRWTGELIPTGTTAALIGAPALILLARRQLQGMDQGVLSLPGSRIALSHRRVVALGAWVILAAIISLTLSRGPDGWTLTLPDAIQWHLRWPRALASAAAGAGLAVAGVILQRVLRNPLASPDMLGLSAGAALALLLAASLSGQMLTQMGPLAAFVGAMLVLAILLWIGRGRQQAPGMIALVGIALTAVFQGLLEMFLARATVDSYALLSWLSGSTYRLSAGQAGALLLGVSLLTALTLAGTRVLTLLGLGDGAASARGLSVTPARLMLLTLAALLCAVVTSLVGPIAFLGLLAPHLAHLAGAYRIRQQIVVAAVLGAILVVLADWLGRYVLFPVQVPAGLMATCLCGLTFTLLLLWGRWHRNHGEHA